jgi:hypothetical protein
MNMKTHVASTAMTMLLAIGAMTRPGLAQQTGDKGRERIGIYDSRAVAVAYAGSAFQEQKMKDLTAQLKKAKETGDAKE